MVLLVVLAALGLLAVAEKLEAVADAVRGVAVVMLIGAATGGALGSFVDTQLPTDHGPKQAVAIVKEETGETGWAMKTQTAISVRGCPGQGIVVSDIYRVTLLEGSSYDVVVDSPVPCFLAPAGDPDS